MGIYVWGTGCGASELIARGLHIDQIAAFVDSSPVSDAFLNRPVLTPDKLDCAEVTLIIISCRYSSGILKSCLSAGIPREKILFTKNHHILQDLNMDYTAASAVLGEDTVHALCAPCRTVRPPLAYSNEYLDVKDLENDYVRVKTLELICRNLKDIPGAAAEVGVYRGAFARCINQLMPDRKLYLFDSFDGFEESEAKREQAAGTCTDSFIQAHRNTSADRVLAWMPHKERVELRVGYFPDSLSGLEERFCLVSLDVDFEETTYAALQYFWPRITPGGYILLHDYNSHTLAGVRRALKRYEDDLKQRLPGIPLCDVNGTYVLCKT